MNVCIFFNLFENVYIIVGVFVFYSWYIFVGEVVSLLLFEKFIIFGGMGKY